MGLKISAPNAQSLGHRIWLVDMPPHQVRFFGTTCPSREGRSVIAVTDAIYDEVSKSLSFDVDEVVALNAGTLAETIAIGNEFPTLQSPEPRTQSQVDSGNTSYGRGDREFIALTKEILSLQMQRAAASLLEKVRAKASGDLKRGQARNFSETPDNFWYVVVQPQVQHLQITVRGPVAHFEGVSQLELRDDRGNTRFKITSERDVDDAIRLIFRAKRKR
jgi:hypothetical protein